MASNAGKGQRHEFRVVISGLPLTAQQQEQLSHAVQSAAMQVMATFDFHGDKVALALPLRLGAGGGTRGLQYVGVPQEVADRLVNEEAAP